MPTAINALSGVQWTHLDGIITDAAERTTTIANISGTSTFIQNTENMMDLLERNRDISSVSWAELEALGNNSIFDGYDGTPWGSANAPRVYAVCVGEEAARRLLAPMPVGSVSMIDEHGRIRFVSKTYAGEITVEPPETDRWELREWGYPQDSIKTATSNPFTSNMTLAKLNQITGLSIDANTRLSRNQWQTIINKLKEVSYKESSKLSAADGGGLKTYNGKWYANGQELSYLDITFAVRVNQLFVINNTVTDYLSQLQKNNIKIKNANAIAAVISAAAPPGSSGSTNISQIQNQLLSVSIEAGLMPGTTYASTQSDALNRLTASTVPIGTRVLFKNAEGNFQWLEKSGSLSTPIYLPRQLTDVNLNWSKVAEMFPQSITKLLTLDANGMGKFKTGTLSQNDCTTMVTELKSYTTSVESSSQVAQTQLDQYNNKRTEVLDNISNIIKGNNTTLNSVSKNLGAL